MFTELSACHRDNLFLVFFFLPGLKNLSVYLLSEQFGGHRGTILLFLQLYSSDLFIYYCYLFIVLITFNKSSSLKVFYGLNMDVRIGESFQLFLMIIVFRYTNINSKKILKSFLSLSFFQKYGRRNNVKKLLLDRVTELLLVK